MRPRAHHAGAESTEPAATTGLVHVVARPTAEVFLGDESFGITPLTHLSLPVGRHVLELRWAEVRRSYTVVVRGGETTILTARLDEPRVPH